MEQRLRRQAAATQPQAAAAAAAAAAEGGAQRGGGGKRERGGECAARTMDRHQRRNEKRRRELGTYEVGAAVKVLRPGDAHGQLGRVVSAKCGYYTVELSGGYLHFRGTELQGVAEEGQAIRPPPRAAPPRPRAPAKEPSSSREQAMGPVAPPRDLQSTTDDDPSKPKWWWESWQIDGPRKRKPTQLYEAGPSSPPGGGRGDGSSDGYEYGGDARYYGESFGGGDGAASPGEAEFGGGGESPYPPARDAGEPEVEGVDDENGGGGGGGGVLCQIGSEVMVLKSEHMNHTGTVVGTHNGYYQVEMDGGRGWLNCRLKSSTSPTVSASSRRRAAARTGRASATLCRRRRREARAPERLGGRRRGRRGGDGAPVQDLAVAPKKDRAAASRGASPTSSREHRDGAPRRPRPRRDGEGGGARNGYLIVRIDGELRLLPARDLYSASAPTAGRALPPRRSYRRQPAAARRRRRRRAWRRTAGRRHGRPTTTAGGRRRAGQSVAAGGAVADDDRAPRLSWRDNVVDEDYEVPQHEHSYERAVKMAPREMASVAARVEYLLALHPPEVMAAGVEAPDFRRRDPPQRAREGGGGGGGGRRHGVASPRASRSGGGRGTRW